MDCERILLEHLPLIDRVVRFIARRHHLSADEAGELASSVRLKLIEDDYDVLRKFEGRSSLQTYLTAVINRLFLDQRAARLGKWRPSAQARRLGPVGRLLDQLLTRDGLPFDEAVALLRSKHGILLPLTELEAIRERLPARGGRSFVGQDEIDLLPAAGTVSAEDDAIRAIDMVSEGERVEGALASALGELSAEEQLILKMRFLDDLQVAQIARLLGVEQKPLYRRIEHVMGVLRGHMTRRGVVAERVRELIEYSPGVLDSVFEKPSGENHLTGPSIP